MHYPKKVTPRVKDGRVQRKNPRDVQRPRRGGLSFSTEIAGSGFNHVVDEADVRRFLMLLPDFEELSRGLHEVVLAEGDRGVDGWYERGTVAITAWPIAEHVDLGALYVHEHRDVFERLGVWISSAQLHYDGVCPDDRDPDWWFDLDHVEDDIGYRDGVATHELQHVDGRTHAYVRRHWCLFDRRQARAYQLLHVLLHELGHHRDAIRAPHRGYCVRGESYAEHYANRHADKIWSRYERAFGRIA